MDDGRQGKPWRSAGVGILLLCLVFGAGSFLGARMQRSRSTDTVVLTRGAPASASAVPQTPVDINTADAAELETLPGIGPALAERIVEYREKNGPFRYCYELTDISGIGSSTYEALRELITVGPS